MRSKSSFSGGVVTAAVAGALSILISAAAAADTQTVTADSLTVKERLRSLEQINVTAEKDLVDATPLNEELTEILDEAARLDRVDAPEDLDQKPSE